MKKITDEELLRNATKFIARDKEFDNSGNNICPTCGAKMSFSRWMNTSFPLYSTSSAEWNRRLVKICSLIASLRGQEDLFETKDEE